LERERVALDWWEETTKIFTTGEASGKSIVGESGKIKEDIRGSENLRHRPITPVRKGRINQNAGWA